MNVLQIHNRYARPGGEDTVVAAEAARLTAAGHRVTEFRADNPESAPHAVARLAVAPWNPVRYREIRRLVRADRPDVAHLHNTWFSLSPSVVDALHAERVPIVMTLHNYRLLCANGLLFRDGTPCTDCVGTGPWRAVRHACYRDSRAQSAIAAATIAAGRPGRDRITRFLAPSEFVRDRHVDAGVTADRIVVVPHAVADPGLRAAPPSASTQVLYVGRLAPEKGLDVLLDAWQAAGLTQAGLELVVVGDGPLRRRLTDSAPAGVRITGWLPGDRVGELMRSARALVFPTRWYESFGMVAAEAMAAGLPVLAADVAGPAEVVRALGPDWLVPRGDRAAWARALLRLADNAAVDAAGASARYRYLARYSEAAALRALLAAYDEAIRVSQARLEEGVHP